MIKTVYSHKIYSLHEDLSNHLLKDTLHSKFNPFIEAHFIISHGIVSFKHCMVAFLPFGVIGRHQVLVRMRHSKFLRSLKCPVQHTREVTQHHNTILVRICFCEQLKKEPVKLRIFSTTDDNSSFNKPCELFQATVVKNWMCSQCGSPSNYMFHTEFQPLIHSDHPCALQVHGVEHLLPGLLLLNLCLVQLCIHRSISILPWDRGSHVDKFGEGTFAYKTISVGVDIHKHLDKTMVELGMSVTLLIFNSLFDEPNEILLGLIEASNIGCCE